MRLSHVILAASGVSANLAYEPPMALMLKAQESKPCVLPEAFKIKNFSGISSSTTGQAHCFHFAFIDPSTNLSTVCKYNGSSASTTQPGPAPRHVCRDSRASFIWQEGNQMLTLLEQVCPEPEGSAEYEAAGSVQIALQCQPHGEHCVTNSTEYMSNFTSLDPIRN